MDFELISSTGNYVSADRLSSGGAVRIASSPSKRSFRFEYLICGFVLLVVVVSSVTASVIGREHSGSASSKPSSPAIAPSVPPSSIPTTAPGSIAPTSSPSPIAANAWTHDWQSTSNMTWTDFGYSLLSPQQAAFASSKYRIISIEKCTGKSQGVTTEAGIYQTARQLKQLDPDTKVLFYLNSALAGIGCYAANAVFMAHPEWWLRDPKTGAPIPSADAPHLNYTNPEAREWWASIPLGGSPALPWNSSAQAEVGQYEGTAVVDLIDGVLADSAGYDPMTASGLPLAEVQALNDAKFAMIGELQARLARATAGRAAGPAAVVANGINMYASQADPRYPGGHDLHLLDFCDGVMNEHTAVFESVNAANGSLNVQLVATNLDVIEAAAAYANGSKAVFVSTWPGLYSSLSKTTHLPAYPPTASGGEPTPAGNAGWQAALAAHFAFAHALYLSVAQANVWFNYAGVWYGDSQGFLACPEAPQSCMAPPGWYPDLDRPLGRPLGARTPAGPYAWRRAFERAAVYVDLLQPNRSKVTFK